jgi:hypothetical protein
MNENAYTKAPNACWSGVEYPLWFRNKAIGAREGAKRKKTSRFYRSMQLAGKLPIFVDHKFKTSTRFQG